MFRFCSSIFAPLLLNDRNPIRRPNAHAARHSRQGGTLRRADAGGWGVSLAGGARRPALPDARRQGQRRAARQSQCVETWCPVRPHPRDRALSARHQPRDGPPDAGGCRFREGRRQTCREGRRHRHRIRKNQKNAEQPHAPGNFGPETASDGGSRAGRVAAMPPVAWGRALSPAATARRSRSAAAARALPRAPPSRPLRPCRRDRPSLGRATRRSPAQTCGSRRR